MVSFGAPPAEGPYAQGRSGLNQFNTICGAWFRASALTADSSDRRFAVFESRKQVAAWFLYSCAAVAICTPLLSRTRADNHLATILVPCPRSGLPRFRNAARARELTVEQHGAPTVFI
jgi:hypothetical protein